MGGGKRVVGVGRGVFWVTYITHVIEYCGHLDTPVMREIGSYIFPTIAGL